MDPDMGIPVPSVLFGQGGKCMLNWALVLLQKDHIWRSFVCVFSLSLAIVDTILTLIVTFIYLQGDSNILGWRVTMYHLCLLVQILGYMYSAQHFSILLLTTLEHLYIISRRLRHSMWKPTWIFQLFLTLLTWVFSILFVFKFSNVQPYLEDLAFYQINQCLISSSSVISELVVVVVFLCLCWMLWKTLKNLIELAKNPHSSRLMTMKTQFQPKFMFITKVAKIFWDTWALFLIFLLFHVVLPIRMPSHLGLNCAWLCFVNSLLITVALCVVSPTSELAQGLAAVPPDSFCDWKMGFTPASDSRHEFTIRERRS